MIDTSKHVALVTGASRGIGRAIALKLAEAGIDVAIGYERKREEAESVVQQISTLGQRAVALRTDLRDPQQITRLVQSVEEALGSVDILVSNAAIGPQRSLEEITVEEWDDVMQVNLRAAFLLAQRVIPGMRKRGWGRIILISSVAAFTGGVVGAHYAASKAGQMGLMHALAGALALDGITVNAIAPALIESGTTLPGGEEEHRQLATRIPIGRLGQPEEVADAGPAAHFQRVPHLSVHCHRRRALSSIMRSFDGETISVVVIFLA
ncbi:MAG TPA: SDR family NAD(P)-dependent oxidoreductase [Ktedonosporobacter sp.]|nr:SDR family NAD(P)-dependent oxidoreductase [Ktedonosporobacter sp.]